MNDKYFLKIYFNKINLTNKYVLNIMMIAYLQVILNKLFTFYLLKHILQKIHNNFMISFVTNLHPTLKK
jgi:hypothetical protein